PGSVSLWQEGQLMAAPAAPVQERDDNTLGVADSQARSPSGGRRDPLDSSEGRSYGYRESPRTREHTAVSDEGSGHEGIGLCRLRDAGGRVHHVGAGAGAGEPSSVSGPDAVAGADAIARVDTLTEAAGSRRGHAVPRLPDERDELAGGGERRQ